MLWNKKPDLKAFKIYAMIGLSDLQGAWSNLRDALVEDFGFQDSDKMLFHIDEAMSWESVRNLNHMRDTLLLIENIAAQTKVTDNIQFWLDDTRSEMENIMDTIKKGEKV